ncbi:RAM signaling network component, variant 2 [Xanthoria parietina]
MNHQDNIRIITQGVDEVRQEAQALCQEAGAAPVELELTVDLKKKNIYEVPEEAIDILRPDVKALHLANNQIYYLPDHFSSCSRLRYLNLRENLFQDFPKPLLSLSQLEVLDLGFNRIRHFPDDIGRIRALRFFDMTRNSIKSVPRSLKDLNNLKVLKLGGNPLRPDIARIVATKETYASHEEMQEHLASITSDLKNYLKGEAASKESEGSSEGPLETPRPLIRNGSHRFPLKSNGTGPESSSEAKSPRLAKPPIPMRSHYRVTSGQENMVPKPSFRRPGLTPLFVGNERNRSNSESVLQVTQNNRSKRMGIVTKKNNDLVTVKENQQHRSSFHLRGQSHASALREWHGEEELDSSGPVRAHRRNRRRHPDPVHPHGSLTPYLSKLRNNGTYGRPPPFGDTAKGLKFSLSTFEQCTKDLIKSLPSSQPRQWSRVRDAQHDAEFGMNGLHHSINSLIRGERKTISSTRRSRKKDVLLSINACLSAVALYTQLGHLLLNQSAQLLAEGERMYIRNIIVLTLGCSAEACHALNRYAPRCKRSTITQKWLQAHNPPALSSHLVLQDGPLRDQSLTPTRERPVTAKRIVRNGTTSPQHGLSFVKPAATSQPAVPLFFNGRSRSNSRADQYPLPSSADSTFPFSPMMTPALTPQSSGLFSIPGTPLNRSRSSSVAAGTYSGRTYPLSSISSSEFDYGSQIQFDKVCNPLESTVVQGRKILPIIKEHFTRCLNEVQAERDRACKEEWSKRVRTCSMASELNDAMSKRIQAVRFQDPNLRNEKSFWDLCRKYLRSIGELLEDVRGGITEGYFKQDIINLVRPIYRSSKEATTELQDSPWNSGYMGNNTTTTSPASINSGVFGHSRGRDSSGSNSDAINAAIPSTPLSAALGPAAQATVPSMPASGNLEKCLQKNFFDKYDAYQQVQQTMVHRR